MRYRYWRRPPHCRQEDLLWQTRDSHHATLHLGLDKGRSHQANHRWKMVVQGITRGQAPPRVRLQHRGLCLVLLCLLHLAQRCHSHHCIPDPTLQHCVIQRVWLRTLVVDVRRTDVLPSTRCEPCKSGEAGISSFKGSMPSNGLTQLCLLDQPMGQRLSSISSTTLIAFGRCSLSLLA